MDCAKSTSDTKSEHLATLHYECTNRAKEISEKSGITIPDDISSFVTETTFRFCHILAADIESFAKHAKRSTVNLDDVLLFARRNPLLVKFLEDKSIEYDAALDAEDAKSDVQPAKRKKQPKLTATSKTKGGHASKIKDSPSSSPLKSFFVPLKKSAANINSNPKDNSPFQSPTKFDPNIKKPTTSFISHEIEEVANRDEKTPENTKELKASTPRKSATDEPTTSAPETSLIGDIDDFSNIFDDFDEL